jgi:cell division transport system permease protein
MSAKKKTESKALTQQKHGRRRLLTFLRICRYGFESFVRNSWLSVAATAVMVITLLIIFTAFVAQNILTDTVGDLRNKVNMSIYLKTDTTDKVGTDLMTELKKLSSVRSVRYCNADCARSNFADSNKDDVNVLNALNAATNEFPATLSVVVTDINDTSQLQKFVDNDALLKDHISADHKPSFAGERRNTIKSIGRAVSFAQKVGILAGSIFVIISSLIIFNTIRMAIFNRREEIQMMKLIGADQSFIRGPFLVEAILYGVIAAIIATGVGVFCLFKSVATLSSYQITTQPTINLITNYMPLVLVAMMVAGATIGIISSLLATGRYLKV